MNDLKLGTSFQRMGHDVSYLFPIDPCRNPRDGTGKIQAEKVIMKYWYQQALVVPGLAGKLMRHVFERSFLRQLIRQKLDVLRRQDLILVTGRPLLSSLKEYTSAVVLQSIRGIPNKAYFRYYDKPDGVIFWGGCHEDHPKWRLESVSKLCLDPAVDISLFYPAKAKEEIRKQLRGTSKDGVAVTYIGRLDPVHQVDRIIEACGVLIKQGLPLKLNVVGSGSMLGDLQTYSRSKLPLDTFSFLGMQSSEEIADLLRASDIFVINPRLVNHPIALMEAVSCGTYAVAPKLGRIPKILGSQRYGEMFEANNEEAMIETLRKVIVEKRFLMPKDGFNPHFRSWEENALAILTWYETHSVDAVR